jgi:hypothetical protein
MLDYTVLLLLLRVYTPVVPWRICSGSEVVKGLSELACSQAQECNTV